jgi:hypothetical protein
LPQPTTIEASSKFLSIISFVPDGCARFEPQSAPARTAVPDWLVVFRLVGTPGHWARPLVDAAKPLSVNGLAFLSE